MPSSPSLASLSDTALLDSLHALVARGRQWEVELLRHLTEVERRDLHHARGYSSLFVYCTDALGFDKHATYNRITVARLARRFPRMLSMLRAGQLSLTAAKTLGPQLQASNADELLDAAAGKTVEEIRVLLAERNPKPEVPTSVRKLPKPKKSETGLSAGPLFEQAPMTPAQASSRRAKKPAPQPEPLSKDSYRVTFTGSAEFVGMLEEVVTLLTQAGGKKVEEAGAMETAVRELRDRLRKRKYAVGARPQRKKVRRKARQETTQASRTRRIPNAVRRAVAERDGFQCTYVDPETGRRCCETRFLEYQHCEAFSEGGEHSVENLKLFCRGHNQFAARRDGLIGKDWRSGPDRAVDTAAADGPGHSLWTAERTG